MDKMQTYPRYLAIQRVAVPATGVLLLLALSLSACSQVPEPTDNIDSLTAVTEAPGPSAAAEKYDFELHPEPIVEPLECTQLLVITARGTGEPHAGQLLSPVGRIVKKAFPGEVRVHDLDYPADTDVNEGGTFGVRLLLDTIRVQHQTCPDQFFALLGYSQGALIIGDALSSPEGRLVGDTVGKLNESEAAQVIAVVLYGNPRFSGVESFAVGSFDEEIGGVLPRTLGTLESFADRIQDFCVAGDFICQSSLDLNEEGHVTYFKNGMQQDGAEFLLSQFVLAKRLPAATYSSEDLPAPVAEE